MIIVAKFVPIILKYHAPKQIPEHTRLIPINSDQLHMLAHDSQPPRLTCHNGAFS